MKQDNWELLYQSELNFKKKIKVACIMGYYNGSKYIAEQLQSIMNQEIKNADITIYISDDNSHKDFPSIESLNLKNPKGVNIFYRKLKKNIGYAKNCLYTLNAIIPKFDFYCFSDQDDIWEINKLNKAISFQRKNHPIKSYLYFSRTTYFNENCAFELGKSVLFTKKPSFKNALVQNMAGGNTMVFNHIAKDIICESISNVNFVSHDWWCYQIITGSGGYVHYDLEPLIKYRQHKNNFMGSNNTFKDKIKRIRKLFQNQLRDWNEINLYSLNKKKYLLTKENSLTLKRFSELRKQSFFKRIFLLYKSGIHRQNLMGNLGIYVALIFKKL